MNIFHLRGMQSGVLNTRLVVFNHILGRENWVVGTREKGKEDEKVKNC